jgi:hypothetical protein
VVEEAVVEEGQLLQGGEGVRGRATTCMLHSEKLKSEG